LSDSSELVVVLITAPAGADREMARALVEARLAACVNLVPGVHSVYRWQGAIEEAEEELLIVKSSAGLVERMTALVREMHPYENFELIVLPLTGGSAAYLDWTRDSLAPDGCA
jgi:periplasmic divalent cation tolerance protein